MEAVKRFEDLWIWQQARVLDMAKGACGEVRSMYYSAEDLTYVDHQTAETRRSRTKQIAAGISSLVVGACAEVEIKGIVVKKIESEEKYKCR